jgi:hypothetical protein
MQFSQWLLQLQHRPNRFSDRSIARYLQQEGAGVDHREIAGAVEYLFR